MGDLPGEFVAEIFVGTVEFLEGFIGEGFLRPGHRKKTPKARNHSHGIAKLAVALTAIPTGDAVGYRGKSPESQCFCLSQHIIISRRLAQIEDRGVGFLP